MCGLAGLASTFLNNDDKEFFKDLMIISGIRGLDGTGMISAFENKKGNLEIKYDKKEVPSGQYIKERKQYLLDRNHPLFMMGHCRAGTSGKTCVEFTHPFVYGDLCGMHNGTIHGISSIKDGMNDSMVLYSRMSSMGLQDVIHSLPFDAAYALTWTNCRDKTINILRNRHRTLYYAYNRKRENLAWASEDMILELAISRSKEEWESVEEFKVDTHYKIKMGDAPIFEETEISLTKPFIPRTFPVTKEDTVKKVATSGTFYFNTAHGLSVSRVVLEEMLKQGCSWCTGKPDMSQHPFIGWIDNQTFICPECLQDKENVKWIKECFSENIHINDATFRAIVL